MELRKGDKRCAADSYEVTVFFIDFGNIEVVPASSLIIIDNEVTIYPDKQTAYFLYNLGVFSDQEEISRTSQDSCVGLGMLPRSHQAEPVTEPQGTLGRGNHRCVSLNS